jgi:phosphate transport system substrate-binding protein
VEQLRQSPYSIGYVEYGYAIQSGLPKAQVENRSGKFVAPDLQRTSQALEELVSDGDVFPEIADQTGDLSYPFLCFSWLLVEESYTDSKKAEGIERMVEFGLNEGQAVSESLGFIPLPYAIKKRALEMIDSIDSTYKMRLSANGL